MPNLLSIFFKNAKWRCYLSDSIFVKIPLDNACKVFTVVILILLVRIDTLHICVGNVIGDKHPFNAWWALDAFKFIPLLRGKKSLKTVRLRLCWEKEWEREKLEGDWCGGRDRGVSWIFTLKPLFLHKRSYFPFLYIRSEFNFFSIFFLCFSAVSLGYVTKPSLADYFFILTRDVCQILKINER